MQSPIDLSLISATNPPRVLNQHWEWHVHPDAEAMSRAAAARFAAEVRRRQSALACLATGASPERTYQMLVEHAQAEPDLYAKVRWMKLDEWGGIAMNDPASCESFLRRILLTPLGVPPARYFGWASQPIDPDAECRRVAGWLAEHGPIDIAILGLGENGHLGFNEPAARLQPGPHVAALSPTSLAHAMLGRSQVRPTYGLTLGMDDLLTGRRILLLVSGERKARQLRRLACDGITPKFPASLLRRCAQVSIFCDAAAASLLPPLPQSNSQATA
jgi:galactosamine-6-phosphate isomerase